MHNIFYLGLSGEHCCPLGYLFFKYIKHVKCLVVSLCTGHLFKENSSVGAEKQI